MRIFIIDQHPLMREGIAALMRRLSPTVSVTELDHLAAAWTAAEEHGLPELICLELVSSSSHGVSGLQELRQKFPEVPILVLTAAAAQDLEELSLEAGANAFIEKSASTTEVAKVLRMLLNETPDDEATRPIEKLSKRQKQLLILLDKGMSNRDIAESLEISEHTVKVHLWRLFRRLNVKSRSQASHLARTQGLL